MTARAITRSPDLRGTFLWLLLALAVGCAAGAIASWQPIAALVIAIVAPIGIAVIIRPEWLPAVLVVTVFTESLAVGDVTISRIAAPFALAVLVPRLVLGRLPSPGYVPVLAAAGAYSVWALASALWTLDEGNNPGSGTTYSLASLAISGIYLLVVLLLVRTPKDLRRLLFAVVATATVTSAIAIVDYAGGGGRAAGYDSDPNYFAAMQVFALPLAILLASHARSPAGRLAMLGAVAVIGGSVVVSLSRGGILAMLAVLILLGASPARGVFRTPGRKALVVLVALVGAGALVSVAYSDLSARSQSLFDSSEGGSGRTNLWRAAITGWEERPMIGIGFGAFRGQSNKLLRQTPGVDFSAYKLRLGGQYAHSAYLGTLVELGVIGLALFLTLLVLAWRGMRKAAAIAAAYDDRFLAGASRALAISLAGFTLASVFLSTETDRVLWVLLGLGAVLPRVAAEAVSSRADAAPTVGSVEPLSDPASAESHPNTRGRND